MHVAGAPPGIAWQGSIVLDLGEGCTGHTQEPRKTSLVIFTAPRKYPNDHARSSRNFQKFSNAGDVLQLFRVFCAQVDGSAQLLVLMVRRRRGTSACCGVKKAARRRGSKGGSPPGAESRAARRRARTGTLAAEHRGAKSQKQNENRKTHKHTNKTKTQKNADKKSGTPAEKIYLWGLG